MFLKNGESQRYFEKGCSENRTRRQSEVGREPKTLSERQQMLLERFVDGECGFIDRFVVRRLQQRSSAAKEYLASLKELRSICSTALLDKALLDKKVLDQKGVGQRDGSSIEVLWAQLERRIDEEERAALFLGSRVSAHPAGGGLVHALQQVVQSALSVRESFGPRASVVGVATVCGLVLIGGQMYQGALLKVDSGKSSVALVAPFPSVGAPSVVAPSVGAAVSVAPEVGLPSSVGKNIAAVALKNEASGEAPVHLVSSRVGGEKGPRGSAEEFPLTAGNFDRFSFDQFFASSPNGRERYLDSRTILNQPREASHSPQLFASGNAPRNGRLAVGQAVEVDWMRSDGRVRILHSPEASAPVIFVKKRSSRNGVVSERVTSEKNSRNIILQEPSLPTTSYAR